MEAKKEKKIKRQKFFIRGFWSTAFVLLGYLFAVWQTYANTGHDVLNSVSGGLQFTFLVLLLFGILMIVTFISIGKKEKPKSNDALEQIEKLGKLKAQGLISEQEFEKEKKKLWEQE